MNLPDISAERAANSRFDEELTALEEAGRKRIAGMDDQGHCYGAKIAHEGPQSLAASPPGTTVSQCSLEPNCRGTSRFHPMSNKSCRSFAWICPWCG